MCLKSLMYSQFQTQRCNLSWKLEMYSLSKGSRVISLMSILKSLCLEVEMHFEFLCIIYKEVSVLELVYVWGVKNKGSIVVCE